jgi:predicted DNA-binding ribbon-helix-helix protein
MKLAETRTDTQRQHSNLSSAIRLLVLEFYRSRISAKLDGEKHDVTSPKTPPVLS